MDRWAELRREHFVRGVGIKVLARRYGVDQNTVRRALRSSVRVREEIEPLGFDGGKSIVDDYLREVRPMFVKFRTHQRTVYRPGEICQWDLWEPSAPVPVGHGQLRRAWVVVCCLGYSRAGAGALIFSKEAPDVLWGMTPLRVVARGAAGVDGVGPRGVLARRQGSSGCSHTPFLPPSFLPSTGRRTGQAPREAREGRGRSQEGM